MGYQINTDFSTIEPSMGGARSMFPVSDQKGWLATITLTEANENANKNGMVLHVVVTGQEGPVMGKTHDHYINIVHPKQETVKYAQQEMSAIGHVLGHIRVGNTDEWLNKPLRVVITPDKTNEQYPDSTRLSGWRDVNGNKPNEAGVGAGVAPNTQQFQQAPQNPAGGFVQQQAPQQFPPQGQQGGQPGWGGPTQGQQVQQPPVGQQTGFPGQPGGFDPNNQPPQQFQQAPQQFQQQQQPNPNNINPNGAGQAFNGGGGAPGWAGQQQG